jgi:hypothetical protein
MRFPNERLVLVLVLPRTQIREIQDEYDDEDDSIAVEARSASRRLQTPNL